MYQLLKVVMLSAVMVSAVGAQTWDCGKTKGKVTATLSGGTLTIKGTGLMDNWGRGYDGDADDFNTNAPPPWHEGSRGAIRNVVIENGVTSIGWNAFYGCTGLTSITIPSSVKSIGDGAFEGGLTSVIALAPVPPKLDALDASSVFQKAAKMTLYVPPNNIAAYRGANVWKNFGNIHTVASLRTLSVSGAVGTLSPRFHPDSANYALTVLSRDSAITIAATPAYAEAVVTGTGLQPLNVGSNIFNVSVTALNVTNAYTIAVTRTDGNAAVGKWNCGIRSDSSSVTATLTGDGTLTIGGKGAMADYMMIMAKPWFSFSRSITNLVIENGVTSIGNYAFGGLTGITSITIPNSVTSIGQMAFQGCTGLTSITIPNSVTSIGQMAFSGCTNLKSITISNGVTSIWPSAFHGLTGLTSITIPNSVTSIGDNAFAVTGLTSITIPNSVKSIGRGAFQYCTGLTSITIPNSVTSIGLGAFSQCTGLKSITIPNSVTSIDGIFNGLTGLTSVTIPNSITSIGDNTFANLTGLTSITIPNSVTSIGMGAFFNCTGLTSVTIPNSVTSIGGMAFSGCTGLTSVIVLNPKPPLAQSAVSQSAFYGLDMTKACLYVPSSSINAYRSAAGWKDFSCIKDAASR